MPKQKVAALDSRIINWLQTYNIPIARVALFIVFFWFGALKVLDLSPAGPLAEALTERTVGMLYFDELYIALAILECVIGFLFLVPKATRIVLPLLLVHMAVVCSPLLLVPDMVWDTFMTPTLEGQYIIKNIIIVALAFGVAATAKPFKKLS